MNIFATVIAKVIIMKYLSLIICIALNAFLLSCASDTGSNTTRAGIIAENFVEDDVLSADDLEWDLIGVDETSTAEYHVVAKIKTLNGLGLLVPRKVSVRLRYNEGDWTEKSNWTLISIKYLDESNGRIE